MTQGKVRKDGKHHSQNLNIFPSSANNTILGATNIPNGFEVEITYHQATVDMQNFYDKTIMALMYESTQTFTDNTLGYYGQQGEDMSISIFTMTVATKDLKHCHLVWALQRVAEILYENGQYVELDAKILIDPPPSSPSREKIYVANYYFRKHAFNTQPSVLPLSTSKIKARAQSTTADTDVAGTLSPNADLISTHPFPPGVALNSATNLYNNTASLTNSNITDDSPWSYKIVKQPGSRRLQAPKVFLTVIRTIARLAEAPSQETIRIYTYADSVLKIGCHIYTLYNVDRTPTFEQFIIGLATLVKTMMVMKEFDELNGYMHYQDPNTGRDELVSDISILTYNL